jgi:hypothetical protein
MRSNSMVAKSFSMLSGSCLFTWRFRSLTNRGSDTRFSGGSGGDGLRLANLDSQLLEHGRRVGVPRQFASLELGKRLERFGVGNAG